MLVLLLSGCSGALSPADAGPDSGPRPDFRLHADGGDGDGGTGALMGDKMFVVSTATAQTYGQWDGGDAISVVDVHLWGDVSQPGCSAVSSLLPTNSVRVYVGYVFNDHVLVPGTYPWLVGDHEATTAFMLLTIGGRPDGTSDFAALGTTGSVTLTRADVDRVAGSFSSSFPLEDGGTGTLSGTFDSAGCP